MSFLKNKLSLALIIAISFFIIIILYLPLYIKGGIPSKNYEAISDLNKIFPAPMNPKVVEVEKTSIPDNYRIEIPFTSQAPFSNWDAVHEEACEEASLLMVNAWVKQTPLGTPQDVENSIGQILSFEKSNNLGPSITLSDLKIVAEKHLAIKNLKIVTVNNSDGIKAIIAKNQPVIIGAAGKVLPNPNFRDGGPNYHMLVIKGYDKDGFITNDPGTRNGENFYYKNDELFNAIHDWDATNILNGPKNIMYVETAS